MKLQTLLKEYGEFERCLVKCDVHQLEIKRTPLNVALKRSILCFLTFQEDFKCPT